MKTTGRFTEGNLWQHVAVMSLTNATSLTMLFLVDFVDIYFISRLGEAELAAGVGFAGTVLFFVRALAVAMGIAVSVLVSQNLGRGHRQQAARFALNITLLSLLILTPVVAFVFVMRKTLLASVGAQGETLFYASEYLAIVVPGTLMMLLGMCGGQVIRALGEAQRAMWISLASAFTNALLDPILIFGLHWGLKGAAWATVASQAVMLLLSWYTIIRRDRLLAPWSFQHFREDVAPALHIAIPAMLTNTATPISSAFAARMMAQFGDGAVAAFAVVMRLVPVSLALVFALSGAVAPIIGQNAGAGQFARVRETLRQALKFNWLVVVVVTVGLFFLRHHLAYWFSLSPRSAELLVFFCSGVTLFFGFSGMVFVSNTAFNNLGRPFYSTLANFARVLLGALPMIWLGRHWWGAEGVMIGFMSDSIWVSLVSLWVLSKLVTRYEHGLLRLERTRFRLAMLWPFKRWP